MCQCLLNGLRLGEGRALKTVSLNLAQMLIEAQILNYFHLPCFCQTDVSGWFPSALFY